MPVDGGDELKRTNEIGMAIPVLEPLDITGQTITADALLTQRKFAEHLIERGAHYVFTVKDNQPTLAADIRLHFAVRGSPDFREPPLSLDGAADHWSHREDDDDYYSQPRALFRMMSPEQQKVLFENPARAMGDAPQEIKVRHITNCMKADPAYGEGVAGALGIPMSQVSSG